MRTSKNKPSNSMVERLLKDLWQYLPEKYKDDAECENIRDEADALEAKLLSNPRLKMLQRKLEKSRKDRIAKHESMSAEIRKVRTMFLAHGASKEVLQKVQKLAAKFSGQS